MLRLVFLLVNYMLTTSFSLKILFLNKVGHFLTTQILVHSSPLQIDLFADKIRHSPLGDFFTDYTGGDNYDAACDYLLHRFVSLNQAASTKQIYAHYTCATDTQQIKCKCFFLASCRKTHSP